MQTIEIVNMNQSKIARSLEDARSWAASFHTDKKVETTIQCQHGTAVKIDIIEKGQITDSIIVCRECWLSARDWVIVD